jgi:hypothetical protein
MQHLAHAEKLVIDDGTTLAAVVSSDLIACGKPFVAHLRGPPSQVTGGLVAGIMSSFLPDHTEFTVNSLTTWTFFENEEQYVLTATDSAQALRLEGILCCRRSANALYPHRLLPEQRFLCESAKPTGTDR